MTIRDKTAPVVLACVITTCLSTPAVADDAAAFIGGVFATKLLGAIKAQSEAQQQQAAAAQQRPVPSASSPKSAEQRIAELDKLAAGGYITPAEYKAKKQKIIDSI